MKRIRRRVGDVVRIPLADRQHAYGHLLQDPLIAFYHGVFASNLSVSELSQLPIAFRVWVHNDAIRTGRWPVIVSLALSASDEIEPFMFKQDPITGQLALHHSSFASSNWERPATLDECTGLECAAVWDPEHVEDRLRDLADGIDCKWIERPKSAEEFRAWRNQLRQLEK